MIKNETKTLLAELGRNQFGKALRDFLKEKMDEIKDVTTIPNNEHIATEARGRQFAVKVIEELFSFLEDTKAPVSKGKNPYV